MTFRLWLEEEEIHLEVEDDGHGFNVGQTASQALNQKQLGLLGIQERAALVGGQVVIESNPGQGTRVWVIVPLRRAAKPAKNPDRTKGM